MNSCNNPNENINFTINIGIHVFILFCFLSTFFLLYITELSKHSFENEIHEALEKGIYGALDNIKISNENIKSLIHVIPINTLLTILTKDLPNTIKSAISSTIVSSETYENNLVLQNIPDDILESAFYKDINDTLKNSIQKSINNQDDSQLFIDLIYSDINDTIQKNVNDIINSDDEKYKDLQILLNTIDTILLIDIIQIKIQTTIENNLNIALNKINKSNKNNLKLLLKKIPSDSLIKYYERPSKELIINNKWIKILIIMINVFLLILISSSSYLLRASCNQCVPLKDIIIENVIIFTFIGAIEFMFFKHVAIKYIPVKPSVLISSAIESVKNNLY
jgi:hypothetical protein